MITIEIERDDLTPLMNQMRTRLVDKRRMNAEAAGSMAVPIMENFDTLSSTNHNAFGVASSFWALMKAGTAPGADDEFGWVSMPRPVALRYFGGTVYPGEGKERLAIPARSEAYGKSPRDFTDLRVAFFGGGKLALVQADSQKVKYGRRRKDGSRAVTPGEEVGGGVFFWLVPSATIQGDPNVLPKPEVLQSAAINGLRGYLDFRKRRDGV